MKKNYFKKICLSMFAVALSTATFGQIIPDGTYKIFNENLGQVMSINRMAQPNPQDIIVGRAVMSDIDAMDNDQLWTFTHQGNDIYKIVNQGNSSNLGIKDGWCGQFGDVQATFADGDSFNLFRVVPADAADSYAIQIGFDADCNFGSVNVPPKALDIDGGNPGAKLNTFDADSANLNQTFRILDPSDTLLSYDEFNIDNAVSIFYKRDVKKIQISSTSIASISKVQIFDLSGKAIKEVNLSDSSVDINVSDLSSGLYFARVSNNASTTVKKFLVY
jgi:hypothetical protein